MSTVYYDRNLEFDNSLDISNDYEVNSPPWTVYYQESNPYKLDAGWTKGQNTPRFHARVKKGELIPMTHFHQFSVKGSTGGSLLIIYTGPPYGHRVQYPKYTDVTDWVISEADVEAHADKLGGINLSGDAAAKIYGNAHDTLTFLAELADVRRLFISCAESLLKGKLPTNLKKVSSRWMATRYGWRTLIYDIKSLNQAILNLNGERKRYSEHAVHKQNWVDSSYYSNIIGGNRTRHVIMTVDGTVANKGSVVADVEMPRFVFNPLLTGWELIPFSFVLDWFLNVGKTIAAWSFLTYRPELVASTGWEIRLRRVMNVYCDTWHSSIVAEQSHNWQKAECEGRIQRRIPCDIPNLPQFSLRLNAYKVLDLLAMIVQRT